MSAGRFPGDPEFDVDAGEVEEVLAGLSNLARLQAAYREDLLAQGFTREEALALIASQTGRA